MNSGLAFALFMGLANSVYPFIFKAQGAEEGRQLPMQIVGAAAAAAIAGAVLLVGRLGLGGWQFIALSAVWGLIVIFNVVPYFSVVVHRGPVSISWSVLWAGSVLTAVIGWMLFREPIYAAQPVGLACFVGCLWMMARATRKSAGGAEGAGERPIRKGFWFWLTVATLCGVTGCVLMKWKDRLPNVGDDLALVMIAYLVVLPVLAATARVRGVRGSYDRRTLVLGVLYGGLQVAVLKAAFMAIARLGDVSVVFPVVAGVSIFFGVLWSTLRGERPTRPVLIGVALAILSIVLINLKAAPLLPR